MVVYRCLHVCIHMHVSVCQECFCFFLLQNIQLESQVDDAESHSSTHTETYQEQVLTLKSQLDDIRKVIALLKSIHSIRQVCVLFLFVVL